jgi:hypothetical protein
MILTAGDSVRWEQGMKEQHSELVNVPLMATEDLQLSMVENFGTDQKYVE